MTKPKLAAQQSDECRALQEAIDARTAAFHHLEEKKSALAKTEGALVEIDALLKNAAADLEQEIVEASDVIGSGEIAPLPDRAADCAQRIAQLRSQAEFHARVRDKLKGDLNQASLACKRAQDELDRAQRPLMQAESARIAKEIDVLEVQSSELRARLHAMAGSAPDGLDCLSLRAFHMVRNIVPPPTGDPGQQRIVAPDECLGAGLSRLARSLSVGSRSKAAGGAVKAGKAVPGPKLRVHAGLGCVPLELAYNFETTVGMLIMADGNRCDMQACIAIFAAIDPGVGVIVTFSGIDKDAVYMRHGQGWQAESRRRR